MRKLIPILFLTFLVVVSGCVNTGGEEKVVLKGVEITDFSPSTDIALGGGKTVILRMEVENKGSYPAKNVMACIFGSLEGKESVTKQGMWYLKSDQCQKLGKDLSPFDPETGQGGGGRFRWELISPYISYPDVRKDEFKGRIYYEYQSTATVTVPIYSEEEYLAKRQRGEDVKKDLKIVKSVGPVDIDVFVPQPVIAEDKYFSMKITITNAGNGVVFDPKDSLSGKTPNIQNKIGNIRLKYTVPDGLKINCEDYVELYTTNSRSITCDVEIKDPKSVIGVKEFPITIKAEYGYYAEKTTTISVEKTR